MHAFNIISKDTLIWVIERYARCAIVINSQNVFVSGRIVIGDEASYTVCVVRCSYEGSLSLNLVCVCQPLTCPHSKELFKGKFRPFFFIESRNIFILKLGKLPSNKFSIPHEHAPLVREA